jgi:soluble lytic murein transglycosylase
MPDKAARLVALGLDADAEAHLSSNEAEVSAPYGGRETEALCSLYGQLSRAKRRYKVGSNAVSFESLMRAPSPADRWSWECLYPSPYADRVTELEAEYSIPRGLVHSLMRQESAFDPEIRSPVGAQGLLQLMPTTAKEAGKECGVEVPDPSNVTAPELNLRLGTFYIAKMLKTFEGSTPLAAAGYNAGPKAVSRWVEGAKEHETDVFVARIPYEETRNYVVRVMGNFARYQWLAGGDAVVMPVALELPKNGRAGDDDY